jgi:monolysocardiolipin acyltransferase
MAPLGVHDSSADISFCGIMGWPLGSVDEPFMWGSLPLRNFLNPKTLRWTLGASDMMFNVRPSVASEAKRSANPPAKLLPYSLRSSDAQGKLDSWFFTKGQVIETFRGKGIYQKAIDVATQKLEEGNWVRCGLPGDGLTELMPLHAQVHIFPEGRIKQEDLHNLRRFKWGISRMLMECERLPLIVPVWIKGTFFYILHSTALVSESLEASGFEQVMDEPRVWPNFAPRLNKDVTILFGDPINSAVEPHLAKYHKRFPEGWRPADHERSVELDLEEEPRELARMRSEMAKVMRRELMRLGERVEEVEKRPPGPLAGW